MLREQAQEIWKAGVAAVDSDRLVRNVVSCDRHTLSICGESFALDSLSRLIVLGTGKAGAGMASAIEAVLSEELTDSQLTGWVNVPADCVRLLRRISLHAARLRESMSRPRQASSVRNEFWNSPTGRGRMIS